MPQTEIKIKSCKGCPCGASFVTCSINHVLLEQPSKVHEDCPLRAEDYLLILDEDKLRNERNAL